MFDVDVLAINGVSWGSGGTGVSLAYQPSMKVMQYSGLNDKNGIEIYEGDIIHADESSPIGNAVTAQIYFKEAGFALLTTQGSDTSIGYLVMIFPYAEVIGNIYENPELLKA